MRVWTMRQSDRLAFASRVSTSETPTQSLIMCRGMKRRLYSVHPGGRRDPARAPHATLDTTLSPGPDLGDEARELDPGVRRDERGVSPPPLLRPAPRRR